MSIFLIVICVLPLCVLAAFYWLPFELCCDCARAINCVFLSLEMIC